MSNNKKDFKLSIGVKVVMIILIIATLIIMLTTFKNSYNGTVTDKNIPGKIDNYTSIESLYSSTNINIDLPEWITSRTDLEIRDVLGQIIEIGCDDFVIKVANFVDVNADPLGLYEKSETDNSYYINTENTDIKYFRYRLGYPNYTNCTLINWCTNTTSYGMMLSGIHEETDVLKMFNIDTAWINTEGESNIKYDTQIYNIGNVFNISLPIFESPISLNDLDGYTTIYLNKKLCIILVYNDYDIDNNTFESNDAMQLDDNIIMYYYKDNPFKEESTAYNDYNKFLSTVNDIADSIEYQN